MGYEEIVQLISTVGFPIFACGYMGWRSVKDNEAHKDEVDKLADVIEANTLAIQHMTDTLSK